MTTPWRRFPDVQAELVAALESHPTGPQLGLGHVAIEAPANLAQVLPFARVVKRTGNSDHVNGFSTVDLDVWDELYTDAERLAEQIRQWLVGPPPPIVRFDKVVCEGDPVELPWPSPTPLRRFGAVYAIETRRYTVR